MIFYDTFMVLMCSFWILKASALVHCNWIEMSDQYSILYVIQIFHRLEQHEVELIMTEFSFLCKNVPLSPRVWQKNKSSKCVCQYFDGEVGLWGPFSWEWKFSKQLITALMALDHPADIKTQSLFMAPSVWLRDAAYDIIFQT